MTKELDICVSDNSNLILIEEKETGRCVATLTMKGSTKEERIRIGLKLVECYNSHVEA